LQAAKSGKSFILNILPVSSLKPKISSRNYHLHKPVLCDTLRAVPTVQEFADVQRRLQESLSELMETTDPKIRQLLLRDMRRLLAEADRILGSPKLTD
jgi:hypothetical protein